MTPTIQVNLNMPFKYISSQKGGGGTDAVGKRQKGKF